MVCEWNTLRSLEAEAGFLKFDRLRWVMVLGNEVWVEHSRQRLISVSSYVLAPVENHSCLFQRRSFATFLLLS